MSNRRAGMARPPRGRGRNWQARPEARRPGPEPPKLTAQGLGCRRAAPRVARLPEPRGWMGGVSRPSGEPGDGVGGEAAGPGAPWPV